MKQLPLNALRVFESVAKCGSFKEAADALCVSQSAVSHQIKHLELWLNKPLFDRSGSRPVLLPHARLLSDTLSQALGDIDSACESLRNSGDLQSLVIAAVPSVAVCWLIPRLSLFKALHPDIATRIVYNMEGRSIDFSQVDLAFAFFSSLPDFPHHQAQIFQTGISVPVCSPSLASAFTGTNLLETIIRAGLLHDSSIDGWTEWLSRAGYPEPTPSSGPVFEDFNLLRAAALAGQGMALCPLALIKNDLECGQLVQLSNIAINENYNYYLIKRKTDHSLNDSAAEHFSRWVFSVT